MKHDENLDLGINPREINETEARRLALIMNLIKYRRGLSFEKIRKIMPDYYNNENFKSDQKKLYRDIEELGNLGICIKFSRQNEFGEDNLYFIDNTQDKKYIQFKSEELEILSEAILENWENEFSSYLFSASQKIFHSNLQFFPRQIESSKLPIPETKNETNDILFSLLRAIKDKIPLRISYFKSFPDEVTEKEIDPLQITKRNSSDFYLIAFDRQKKEKKRYLIPKIIKLKELGGEFLINGKLNDNDFNYHALNFSTGAIVELILQCLPEFIWKLENFLYPHPFIRKENLIKLVTQNSNALYSFMWKEPEVIISVNSEDFLMGYQSYIQNLKKTYQ
jgi:predicted DNA-binding transcriptional regulator YafY